MLFFTLGLLFLAGVKGVAYIMNAISKFVELFANNISAIVLVIIFLWICSMMAYFTVHFLVEYIVKYGEKIEKAKSQSEKDRLTELYNMKNFMRLFNKAIENAAEKKEPVSVLVIDIDYFHKVNYIYGSLAGDSILTSLAYILSGACCKLDILGRIERDKFSIVLYKCSNNKAIEIAERIRGVIEKYPFVLPSGKIIYITVSIGISTYPDTTGSPEVIFNQADKSLQYAKQTGKNKVSSI